MTPAFPSLVPRVIDQQWFSVDKPCDDETELTQLEKEHQTWLTSITQNDSDIIPIGKNPSEHYDEEEEDDDEDDDNDDESESNEDDEELEDNDELTYDQDSPMFH